MGEWLVPALIGFASGVLSGAFGVGGGILTTPGIRLIIGAPALVAVGTPLPVIVPGAITGAITYARNGQSDVRAGVLLGAFGSLTSLVGAYLTSLVGGSVVLLATVALIVWAAIDTLLQARAGDGASRLPPTGTAEPPEPPRVPVSLLAGIGALTGLYSGFLGLGGGFVLVPMLTRWGRFSVKRAIGTSLVTVAILAVPGTAAHAWLGHIDWQIAAGLAVGVVPGALLGARITLGASERIVRSGFAGMLVVAGLWLAVNEITAVLR